MKNNPLLKPKTIKDQQDLDRRARKLAASDREIAHIFERLGPPPFWRRPPGLATLVHIVLEQQVSLASGRAAFAKLKSCCGGRISTKRILELGEKRMHSQARLTRQKSKYVLAIAQANQSRALNFKQLESLPDDQVREQLMQVKGIGIWTADVYLLMALRRSDIMPLGDLALEIELAHMHQLPERPDNGWLIERAKSWRPNRAVAARMIWHSYLDRLGRHSEITAI